MKLLSLVFSFRNEEENLENLISRLNNSLANLTNWKSEYIFVNDDSSDKSEELLVKLQKNKHTNSKLNSSPKKKSRNRNDVLKRRKRQPKKNGNLEQRKLPELSLRHALIFPPPEIINQCQTLFLVLRNC